MERKIQSLLFVAVAFLLGSINSLYSVEFYIFLVLAFLFNIKSDFKNFLLEVKKERRYLILPLLLALYFPLHYLGVSIFIGKIDYKASWGTIELLLLYFLFVPLYVVSAKKFVTPLLLRRFLFALCWGILVFNFTKFFYLTGFSLFTDPLHTLGYVYNERFGTNMELLGGQVYLEPQALYLAVAAVISYFFLLKGIQKEVTKPICLMSVVIFVLSLIFLSFTVTKGAILAFLGGGMVLSVVYFIRLSRSSKWVLCTGIVLAGIILYQTLPQAYIERGKEMKKEFQGVIQGEYNGNSISPRAGIMKENFSHWKEFVVFGLGVYEPAVVRHWYPNSPYIKVPVTNAHNSFIEFWLRAGILGLVYICYLFIAPVGRMIKKRKYSVLLLAVMLTLFIANNTCILIVLVDSNSFVIMMLAMAFLYGDKFIALEQD